MSELATASIEVPAELRAAFEDALNRDCMRCAHPVRDHLSTAACGCCKKGVKPPSQQLDEAAQVLKELDEAAVELWKRHG
jgi:hypothetical protein